LIDRLRFTELNTGWSIDVHIYGQLIGGNLTDALLNAENGTAAAGRRDRWTVTSSSQTDQRGEHERR